MRSQLAAFVAGVLFAVGLAISGMTQPAKVIGFLDFFHDWDPSLVFVMGGAVVVYFIAFRFLRGEAPLFASRFTLPTKTEIDRRLLIGSSLFGAGWGLSGYCPGPAITSIGSASSAAAVFCVAMVGGMLIHAVAKPR